MSNYEKVRSFTVAMGQPAPERFTEPPLDLLRLRLRLILEETYETIEAAGLYVDDDVEIDEATAPDWPEVIDGICDLLYVTYGLAVTLGIDVQPFFDEVHRSNMAKLGPDGKPVLREDGKIQKPPGWTPPDIAGILERVRGGDL